MKEIETSKDYVDWWWNEGSALRPQGNEDVEEFAHRITQIAWSNGAYKAVKQLTDEEIISTMVQFDVYSNDDQCLIEAGKAILRKASEK